MIRRIIALLPLCLLLWMPALRAHGDGTDTSENRPVLPALRRPPACQPPPPSPEEKEKARLRIGITSQQQAQIESLFQQTGQERRALFTKMHDLYHQLHTLYESYDFDQRKAGAIRTEILSVNRRILNIHAEVEKKLRGILNREQFERMRELMKQHAGERHGRRRNGDTERRPPAGGMEL